jgi:hypothetical protein
MLLGLPIVVVVVILVAPGCARRLESIRATAMIHSGRTYEIRALDSDYGIVVAPALQGRVLSAEVGSVGSTGYVNLPAIERGARDRQFNNFGGQDRLWIGPEAGSYGVYFRPGDTISRTTWRVPEDLNSGEMDVVKWSEHSVSMTRDMELANYLGYRFSLRVDRHVEAIAAAALRRELGVTLPEGVAFVGFATENKLTNTGDAAWEKDKGMLCLWVLGQYDAGARTVVAAPFRAADSATSEPPFNDDYFGRVSVDTPERLQAVGGVAVFRADARREGKFGLGRERSTGVAGSYDPDRRLLVVVKFDVDREAPYYASFSWDPINREPYKGDVFQAYNADSTTPESAENTFYELESVSPCRPLKPGESLDHRHATFCFQGDRAGLERIAQEVLTVSLDELEAALPEPGA